MTKIIKITFLLIFLNGTLCFAKTIQLKDGSVIKGTVVAFQNNTYTIQSSQLGNLQIPDSQIVSIMEDSAVQASPTSLPQTGPQSEIKEKATEVQKAIMNDPQMMQDVQTLTADPEIQALLSDPKLLQSVLTYDPNQIEQSESVKKLLQNPKMQALMQKIGSRFTPAR
jgi:hypothetical protein